MQKSLLLNLSPMQINLTDLNVNMLKEDKTVVHRGHPFGQRQESKSRLQL